MPEKGKPFSALLSVFVHRCNSRVWHQKKGMEKLEYENWLRAGIDRRPKS